jgi:hypothetical protein
MSPAFTKEIILFPNSHIMKQRIISRFVCPVVSEYDAVMSEVFSDFLVPSETM